LSIEFRVNQKYIEEAKKDLKMIVFDLDGTLTKVDSLWRFLHERFGVWEQAKKYKEMFFRGEITYDEWAKLDVNLWKGKRLSEFISVIEEVPLMDGAIEVLDYLSSKYIIVILSSGLDILKYRFENLNIHKFIANKLVFENEIYNGGIEILVKFDNKPDILEETIKNYSIGFNNIAAIGDADNDVTMLEKARLAITVNPKSKKVEEISHIVIRGESLLPLKEIL